ncbi:hypothetical protein EYF80_028561 [Liparis tanakae]|uniref:Uncharacterized protein n=1 Tax=Liparis tanakae TaxID=230148 RepID=A0A4Z2H699_9TELE|nr:hypothetical protein EYF80_028561 [Liparis tanakae]
MWEPAVLTLLLPRPPHSDEEEEILGSLVCDVILRLGQRGLSLRVISVKQPEQREHRVFVVRRHSGVCPEARRSPRLELFYNPESERHISNIHAQFRIDVPI